MSTNPTYHGPEILAAVERALRKVQGDQDKAATVEMIDDSIVITPLEELNPGEELDRIKTLMHKKFGKTFEALSK